MISQQISRLAVILLAIIAIVSSALALRYLYQDAISDQTEISRDITHSITSNLIAEIATIDYILQVSTDEIERQLSNRQITYESVTNFLIRQRGRFSFLDLLRATNPQGETIYGQGVEPDQRASLDQRDYYKQLKNDPTLGMVVAEPIIGKISQKWIWLMARRFNYPDGEFAGIVYAAIFIDDLVKVFEQYNLVSGSEITLLDNNMRIVARATFDETSPLTTHDNSLTVALQKALALNAQEGNYDSAPSTANGVNRFCTYQRNEKYGFTLLVGIPRSHVNNKWLRESSVVVTFLIVFLTGLVLVTRRISQKINEQLQEQAFSVREEERALLKTLIRAIPDLIWLKNPEGIYLACNREFERFFGNPESEIVGKSDYEFIDKELADLFRNNDRRAIAAGKPTVNEEWITYADDGHRALLSTTKAPLRTADGTLIGVLGVAHDITEHKRSMEVLQRQEYLLQEIGRLAKIGGWEADPFAEEGKLTEQVARIYEIDSSEEMNIARWLECCLPESRLLIEAAVARAINEGVPYDLELEIVTAKGNRKWVRTIGDPFFEDEKVIRLLGTIQDITDRKQAEEALRQSEESYRQLFEAESDAIFLISCHDGRIVKFNSAACTLYGYSHAELIQMHSADLFAEHEKSLAVIFNFHAVENQDLRIPMRHHLKKSGEIFPAEMKGRYFKLLGQDVLVVAVRDISERIKVEADLRTAKEDAEASNKSKSEFLANMSHEIRTPLNGVLGMLQLMETTALNDEQKEYVFSAIKSSKRLTRLLSDILDISRIESGKLQVVDSEFNIQEIYQSLKEVFESEANGKGFHLELEQDEALPSILIGDEARLRQILFNIVGNAIKFTEKGKILVEVSLLPSSTDCLARVLVTVSDTGIGISDEDLKTIFEPFVQAEGSYTRNFQGAGLGLSIARRLVKLLAGEIAVDSTPGAGTTIYLSLPFKLPKRDRVDIQQETFPTISLKKIPLRILFAEDDSISSITGKRMLEKSGYSVTAVMDGQEALQRLAKQEFDLILMDIQMPVMDGVEATKIIRGARNLGEKSSIPIIAMTAYAMMSDKEKFLAAGMNDYIAKPVDKAALIEVIERVMVEKGKIR